MFGLDGLMKAAEKHNVRQRPRTCKPRVNTRSSTLPAATTTFAHEPGVIIYMPHPMNDHFTHGIPTRKRVSECRISLTFREIAKT